MYTGRVLEILSLGAGVQSSVVALASAIGVLPRLDAAIFADTQWEPAAVYKHLDWLESFLAEHHIPVIRVTEGNLRRHALLAAENAGLGRAHHNTRHINLPYHTKPLVGEDGHIVYYGDKNIAMVQRQCTPEFKVKPVETKIRELAGLKKGERCKELRVRQWFGISRDEAQRMREASFPWITNYYPLVYDLKWNREQCLEWCDAQGFPRPPRSACIGCPFHGNASWQKVKAAPEEWEDAVRFDRAIRNRDGMRHQLFLHFSRVPLEEADLSTINQQSLYGNECAGVCGV